MEQLAFEQAGRSRAHSQIAFALLCELAEADAAAPALPPLVAAAMEDIRQNYAGLYGVEELKRAAGRKQKPPGAGFYPRSGGLSRALSDPGAH